MELLEGVEDVTRTLILRNGLPSWIEALPEEEREQRLEPSKRALRAALDRADGHSLSAGDRSAVYVKAFYTPLILPWLDAVSSEDAALSDVALASASPGVPLFEAWAAALLDITTASLDSEEALEAGELLIRSLTLQPHPLPQLFGGDKDTKAMYLSLANIIAERRAPGRGRPHARRHTWETAIRDGEDAEEAETEENGVLPPFSGSFKFPTEEFTNRGSKPEAVAAALSAGANVQEEPHEMQELQRQNTRLRVELISLRAAEAARKEEAAAAKEAEDLREEDEAELKMCRQLVLDAAMREARLEEKVVNLEAKLAKGSTAAAVPTPVEGSLEELQARICTLEEQLQAAKAGELRRATAAIESNHTMKELQKHTEARARREKALAVENKKMQWALQVNGLWPLVDGAPPPLLLLRPQHQRQFVQQHPQFMPAPQQYGAQLQQYAAQSQAQAQQPYYAAAGDAAYQRQQGLQQQQQWQPQQQRDLWQQQRY